MLSRLRKLVFKDAPREPLGAADDSRPAKGAPESGTRTRTIPAAGAIAAGTATTAAGTDSPAGSVTRLKAKATKS